MLKEEIVVGKSYVNERACLLREVIEEMDSRHIKYSAFELDSGKWLPARHSICSRQDMQRWADRQARPHEQARIHPFEQEAWFDILLPAQHNAMDPDEARVTIERIPGARTMPQPK